MSDDQPSRVKPISLDARKTTADRAREVQEVLRRSETSSAQQAQRTAQVARSSPAVMTVSVGRLAEAQKAAELLGPGRTSASEQAVYAKMQADPVVLFGGPGAKIEVTGNPWKVIDFSAFVPVVFASSRSPEHYQPRVPKNAVKTEQGLLFQSSLTARDGAEPVQTRAVLVDDGGALIGAECRSPSELSTLMRSSPRVLVAIQASAFSNLGKGARLQDVRAGRGGAYEVRLERDGEVKSVAVNNFGVPLRPDLILADYHLDRYEAAA